MAAARNSSSSYKFHTWVTLLCRKIVAPGGAWPSHQAHRRNLPPYFGGSVDQGLRFLSGNSTAHVGTKLAMGKCPSADSVRLSSTCKTGSSNWQMMRWTLGYLLSLILPLLGKTWNNVLRLEGKVEEVDAVAQVVESVAAAADKALKEVAEELPDDAKCKEAAEAMEHLCCVAAQDSKLVTNLIHKGKESRGHLDLRRELLLEMDPVRAEIDTSAPFESVKEAATQFGGMAFWRPISLKNASELVGTKVHTTSQSSPMQAYNQAINDLNKELDHLKNEFEIADLKVVIYEDWTQQHG